MSVTVGELWAIGGQELGAGPLPNGWLAKAQPGFRGTMGRGHRDGRHACRSGQTTLHRPCDRRLLQGDRFGRLGFGKPLGVGSERGAHLIAELHPAESLNSNTRNAAKRRDTTCGYTKRC